MYLDTEWAHDPADRSDSRAARPSVSLSAHKINLPSLDFSLAYPPAVCNNILYTYHHFQAFAGSCESISLGANEP